MAFTQMSCSAAEAWRLLGAGELTEVEHQMEPVSVVLDALLHRHVAEVLDQGDTRHVISDIRKLQALGWTPQHPPEKSVRDYVAWIKTQAE